jgi:hypothetical protein
MVALNPKQIRNIEIDLAEPFEKILATVLSLPTGCGDVITDRLRNEEHISQVVRELYEAANGRHVETGIGLIRVAPPAYAFLQAEPFTATTQINFLIEAAARLIAGSAIADDRKEMAEGVDDKKRDKASTHYRPIHRARFRSSLMQADVYD